MKSLLEYVKTQAKFSGRQLLSFDKLAEFPAEQVKELERKGIIRRIKDADGIICTECDKHCWKPVETRLKDGKPIGVIYCTDEDCGGLVEVELKRLRQWEITDKIKPYLPKVKTKPDSPPSIKKGNNTWIFNFNDTTSAIPHRLDGLSLIEHLLRNKNKEFYPLELLIAVGQRKEDEKPSEDIYGNEEIQDIRKGIPALEDKLEQTTDIFEKEELESQIIIAKNILKKSRNYKGQSRKISERHRLSVMRKIDRVLNKMSHQSSVIYNHFNSFLTRGAICCYKPDSNIVWDIS